MMNPKMICKELIDPKISPLKSLLNLLHCNKLGACVGAELVSTGPIPHIFNNLRKS